MTTLCKGQPGELPEILDFINMVFSMHRQPHNFQTLLPKLYGNGKECEGFHYLAKEDGKIKAAVCVYPIKLEYSGNTITCATVGSVAVHPYSRGKGYMKQLMALAIDDMEKEHITLSVLDGRRQRYQHYSYEPGGHYPEYQFIADNFRNCSSKKQHYELELIHVHEEDTNYLSEFFHLHQLQPVHTRRSIQDFYDICHSWQCDMYAVIHDASPVGYLCAARNRIYELILVEERYLFSCLDHYLKQCGCDRLYLSTAPYNLDRIRELSDIYERWSVRTEDNYRIFDYSKAIAFFLSIKASMMPLTERSLIFKLGNSDSFKLTVKDQKIGLTASSENPDLVLTDIQAMDLLFSPNAYYSGDCYPSQATVNWFPLPLSISHLDKC